MLIANQTYHIYNRSNNHEVIFKQSRNYDYFFVLLEKYLIDYVELMGYCFMPTHFHLVVKIRSREVVLKKVKLSEKIALLPKEEQVGSMVSEQFRKFFISYSMSINAQERRHGSLFQKNFKYKLIDSINYFCTVMAYIHFNPIEAKLVENYSDYLHSSYYKLSKARKSLWINLKDVRKRFGGKKAFEEFHRIYSMTREIPEMPSL